MIKVSGLGFIIQGFRNFAGSRPAAAAAANSVGRADADAAFSKWRFPSSSINASVLPKRLAQSWRRWLSMGCLPIRGSECKLGSAFVV